METFLDSGFNPLENANSFAFFAESEYKYLNSKPKKFGYGVKVKSQNNLSRFYLETYFKLKPGELKDFTRKFSLKTQFAENRDANEKALKEFDKLFLPEEFYKFAPVLFKWE